MGPPRPPSSTHPGASAFSSGVTTWWSERLAGGSVRRVASPAVNKHRPQAAFFPETRQWAPPQKSDHSGSNKGRWRLPPTGASASVSMATPLPGQSGDSELPTATPWQPAPPEGGPRPSGAEGKLRPGEGPHPAPCPPNSPTRGPPRSTHHSVESAGVDLGR